MRFWTIVLACVLFVFAGKMQYEDALAEQEMYCDMVKNNYWPDFKNGEIDCD